MEAHILLGTLVHFLKFCRLQVQCSECSSISDITINFTESVSRNTGSVQYTLDGTVVESFDIATSNRISVSGSQVIIDPTEDLDFESKYTISVNQGAFRDTDGNDSLELIKVNLRPIREMVSPGKYTKDYLYQCTIKSGSISISCKCEYSSDDS